jgi:hypothetical protein
MSKSPRWAQEQETNTKHTPALHTAAQRCYRCCCHSIQLHQLQLLQLQLQLQTPAPALQKNKQTPLADYRLALKHPRPYPGLFCLPRITAAAVRPLTGTQDASTANKRNNEKHNICIAQWPARMHTERPGKQHRDHDGIEQTEPHEERLRPPCQAHKETNSMKINEPNTPAVQTHRPGQSSRRGIEPCHSGGVEPFYALLRTTFVRSLFVTMRPNKGPGHHHDDPGTPNPRPARVTMCSTCFDFFSQQGVPVSTQGGQHATCTRHIANKARPEKHMRC